MRKNVFSFFLLIIADCLFSQNGYFFIKGENFIQTSGYVVLQDLNWKNNGNEILYSGSYVKFTGSSLQQITGDSLTTFASVVINNTGGGVYLDQNIEVKDTLKIVSGYFDLKDKMADFGTTGYLTGENENNRVRATDASGTEGLGTGVCKATRTNPTGNVAGFGLDFTPSISMGTTEIYRGHLRQAGSNFDNANGGYSILRYYEIHPQNYTTIQINPFNYFDAELNNITPESDLKIMQLQTAPTTWQILPTSLNTTLNTATGSSISNSLNYIKITLAKAGCKLTAQINATPNPVCEGGSVQLSTTNNNAIGSVIYNWSGPGGFSSSQSNPVLSNITTANSGVYYVTVTDQINCTSTAQITINVNTLPVVMATSNGPLCSGTTLQLSASNVSGGSYQWSGPGGFSSSIQNPQITNVTTNSSGTYIVTVTDANGCSNTSSVNVTVNQTPIVNAGNDQSINTGTSTQLNGSITGGSGSYTFYWQPGTYLSDSTILNPTTQILTQTVTFNLIVIDNITGCSDTDQVVVQVGGQALSATISANPQTICYGQSVQLQVNASGGSGNYTYTWASNPPGFSSNQPNPTVSPTQTTTYYVTVNDGYLQVTQSVTITVNSLPNVTITGNTTMCEQSTLQLTASGGGTYNWSGPNGFTSTSATIQITNTTTQNSGTYTVTVTGTNGCTSTQSVNVTINAIPTITITGNTTMCEQSTLLLTASGGDTYNWSGPNGFTSTNATIQIPNATTQNSGTYTVTVTGSNGCTSTQSVSVTVNTLPSVTITGNTTMCEQSTLQLTASGGGTYNWSGPNGFTSTNATIQITNTTTQNSGTYTVTVTGTNGCTSTQSVNVTINAIPTITITGNTTMCEQSTLQLTASGGDTYNWSGPNGFTSTNATIQIQNTTTQNSGTYTVTVTGANGCTNTQSVNVTINAIPTITITGNTTMCEQSTLQLTASGGNTYNWSGPNGFTSTNATIQIPNATTQNSGTYTVTVTGASGCTNTQSVNVTINALPTVTITGNTTMCEQSTLQLTASGGGTYNWSGPNGFTSTNATIQINNVTTQNSGTYSVTVTSVNGCTNTSSVTVTVNTLPVASITGNTTYCEGQTISLNGGSGTTYNWTGPNSFTSTNQQITINNATPSNSGQYIVAVSNTCGTAYDTVNVIVNPKPSLSVQSNSPVCEGQSITITATGTGNFSWVGPAGFTSTNQIITITNATQSNSGNYVVTLTDVNGCTNSASVNVVVQQTPNITITGNTTVCEGSTLQITAQGGTSYQWTGPNNFTSNTNNISITNTTSQNEGTYYVTVSNGTCTSTSSVYVDVIPLPTISVTGDTLLLIGNTTQLTATGADTYQWIPTTNLSCSNCANPIAFPVTTTTYCVIGTQNGCSDSVCIKITVDENCGEIFVPEAFSPNGDGKHDTWSIRGRCIKEIELVIFDRWGEKVFETTDPNETWDGTYKNKPMDTDIYVFVAKVVLITGEEKKFKGDITLIR